MEKFIQKYGDNVTGSISGFDRLVFRGNLLRLLYDGGMTAFLYSMGVLLKDFASYVSNISDRLKKASREYAERLSRDVIYLSSSKTRKEQEARKIVSERNIQEGLICILTCVEPCRSFEIYRNKAARRLELRPRVRKCLHLYHYYIHPVFGFMNARIQSWFPFQIQICVNGREWLSRQMDKAGISYSRQENCFTRIDDLGGARKLMEEQLDFPWIKSLDGVARSLNPIHDEIFAKYPLKYYWSVHQSEWATDVMFKASEFLDELYPSLVRFGMVNFQSPDVMRFLGKKTTMTGEVPGWTRGELASDVKKRPEGVRIKHRLNSNSIKMYNKQGSVLRVETTINNPKDFKVLRPKSGAEEKSPELLPLRKGVVDLRRRSQVSQACNERYFEAAALAENTRPLGNISSDVCRFAVWNDERIRALRPFSPEDSELLDAVSGGAFFINGFRNRDLRDILFPPDELDDKLKTRRKSAVVTRKIRLLRGHGLVRKIPKTHRYLLTEKGREVISAFQTARNADVNSLIKLAA